MIVTEIYNGQGLGNQLACYVTTRVIALDRGFDFSIMNPQKFKCLDFMNLDFGLGVEGGEGPEGGPPTKLPNGIKHYYKERYIIHPNGSNITLDDPNLEKIQDDTKIDGILQSENKIIHRKDEIKKWLKIKLNFDNYNFCDDDTCIINFRGGEYVYVSDFFLRRKYWEDSVSLMKKINSKFKFVVVSDDCPTAKKFFPSDFFVESIHTHRLKGKDKIGIGNDYSIIKNAKYFISSNSSFSYYPIFTSDVLKYAIAPKYWGRHNISDGYWSCGYNLYRDYDYVDRDGNVFSYDECVLEFEKYKKNSTVYKI